jgi:hypothetical protein
MFIIKQGQGIAEHTPIDQTAAERLRAADNVMEELVNLAYERFVRESNFDFRDYLDDEEQARYDAADREISELRRIVIEVLGGVAYVASSLA